MSKSEIAYFSVDTRLAKLLGETYRSTEAALKELVDNAWDSDADKVWITLPTEPIGGAVVVPDDGSGMTPTRTRRGLLKGLGVGAAVIAAGAAVRYSAITPGEFFWPQINDQSIRTVKLTRSSGDKVVISPDGRMTLASKIDHTLRLFEIAYGAPGRKGQPPFKDKNPP
jgi:hypothetical protein